MLRELYTYPSQRIHVQTEGFFRHFVFKISKGESFTFWTSVFSHIAALTPHASLSSPWSQWQLLFNSIPERWHSDSTHFCLTSHDPYHEQAVHDLTAAVRFALVTIPTNSNGGTGWSGQFHQWDHRHHKEGSFKERGFSLSRAPSFY